MPCWNKEGFYDFGSFFSTVEEELKVYWTGSFSYYYGLGFYSCFVAAVENKAGLLLKGGLDDGALSKRPPEVWDKIRGCLFKVYFYFYFSCFT